MLPDEQRSEAWKKKAENTELECNVVATPQGGHFYIVRMGC